MYMYVGMYCIERVRVGPEKHCGDPMTSALIPMGYVSLNALGPDI